MTTNWDDFSLQRAKFPRASPQGAPQTLKKNPSGELLTRSHVQLLLFIHAASFPCQLGRGGRLPVVPVLCVVVGQLSHVCHREGHQTDSWGWPSWGATAAGDLLVRISSNGRSADIFAGSRPCSVHREPGPGKGKYPLRAAADVGGVRSEWADWLETTERRQYLKQPLCAKYRRCSHPPDCYPIPIKLSLACRKPTITFSWRQRCCYLASELVTSPKKWSYPQIRLYFTHWLQQVTTAKVCRMAATSLGTPVRPRCSQ